VLCLGSDWPIAPFDPRVVMAAARLRRPVARPDLAPVGPGQALTGEQALSGYTAAPGLAAGTRTGRIAPGYLADLTAFRDDPVTVPAAELPGVTILLTVVDGVVRHRAD
jgi:predicted amidohydrolase YtcJ